MWSKPQPTTLTHFTQLNIDPPGSRFSPNPEPSGDPRLTTLSNYALHLLRLDSAGTNCATLTGSMHTYNIEPLTTRACQH